MKKKPQTLKLFPSSSILPQIHKEKTLAPTFSKQSQKQPPYRRSASYAVVQTPSFFAPPTTPHTFPFAYFSPFYFLSFSFLFPLLHRRLSIKSHPFTTVGLHLLTPLAPPHHPHDSSLINQRWFALGTRESMSPP